MRIRFLLGVTGTAAILAALITIQMDPVRLAAQQNLPAGMSGESARAMTPFETFADKLGLDEKTQLQPVREIFLAGAAEAGAPARELLQLRQRVLNIELSGQTAELKAALDAYAVAADKIATIEANTMTKVAALLRPNQQNKIPQAFQVLQGMFQINAPAGGGRGRG
jgi:hypothetical protein